MHATDIIAYTYRADHWHRDCVVRALYNEGRAAPAALDMDSESVLAQIAGAEGIYYEDEHSYDSGDFPKVVFADVASDMLDDICGGCGEPIIERDHVTATGCALTRDDFDTDDPCPDGGKPEDHPES